MAEEDVSQRFEQEIMEFGAASPLFTILATLALLNLFCFCRGLKRVIWDLHNKGLHQFAVQILMSGVLVLLNLPVYQGLFFRKENGRIPNPSNLPVNSLRSIGLYYSCILREESCCIFNGNVCNNFVSETLHSCIPNSYYFMTE